MVLTTNIANPRGELHKGEEHLVVCVVCSVGRVGCLEGVQLSFLIVRHIHKDIDQ